MSTSIVEGDCNRPRMSTSVVEGDCNRPRMSTSVVEGDCNRLLIGSEDNHYPLPIVPALYMILLLLVGLLTASFIVPVFHEGHTGKTESFSILMYVHIVVWAFVTIITWYIKAEHKKSRILGYHQFYFATRYLHRSTFYILCGGNVVLLILCSVVRDYCSGDSICNGVLVPVNYQQIIFVLEIALSVCLLFKHIVDVVKFNHKKSPPDVLAEDLTVGGDASGLFVGVRGSNCNERVMERQADILQSLRYRNDILCEQVYVLAQQIQDHTQHSV